LNLKLQGKHVAWNKLKKRPKMK